MAFAARYGTAAVAAYFIGVRILALAFLPGFGFGAAAGTLSPGTRRPPARRAARSGWLATGLAIALMTTGRLALLAFARPIARLFWTTTRSWTRPCRSSACWRWRNRSWRRLHARRCAAGAADTRLRCRGAGRVLRRPARPVGAGRARVHLDLVWLWATLLATTLRAALKIWRSARGAGPSCGVARALGAAGPGGAIRASRTVMLPRPFDVATSFAASVARLGTGMQVAGTAVARRSRSCCTTSRPARTAQGARGALDPRPDAEIRPCPHGGTRFRPRCSGAGQDAVPYLVDPNTGKRCTNRTTSCATWPRVRRRLGATRWRRAGHLVSSGLPASHGSAAAAAPAARVRPRSRSSCGASRPRPTAPRARALCELELPYVLHNVAKGSPKREAFVARAGKMQVPCCGMRTREGDVRVGGDRPLPRRDLRRLTAAGRANESRAWRIVPAACLHHVAFACRDVEASTASTARCSPPAREHRSWGAAETDGCATSSTTSATARRSPSSTCTAAARRARCARDLHRPRLPIWVNHIALRVDRERHGRCASGSRPPGIRRPEARPRMVPLVYFTDPNGILVELCCDTTGMPVDPPEPSGGCRRARRRRGVTAFRLEEWHRD